MFWDRRMIRIRRAGSPDHGASPKRGRAVIAMFSFVRTETRHGDPNHLWRLCRLFKGGEAMAANQPVVSAHADSFSRLRGGPNGLDLKPAKGLLVEYSERTKRSP